MNIGYIFFLKFFDIKQREQTMRKWNLAGLVLFLAACIFATMDHVNIAPWIVLTFGVGLWLINDWFRKITAVRLLSLFVWALYWGLVSAGTFFMSAFAAIAMIFGPVIWHLYLYMALFILFAVISVANLIMMFIEFKRLSEVVNQKTLT